MEAWEEAIKVPEGRWGLCGQEMGKRLEAGKRGFTDKRIGQRVCNRGTN